MAVAMKQSVRIYASVVISASYFVDNTLEAVSSEVWIL